MSEPHFALKEAFNLYYQDGCYTFTKHEVLAYGKGDRKHIANCLANWELKGLVEILKPLEQAADNDIIVKVLTTID